MNNYVMKSLGDDYSEVPQMVTPTKPAAPAAKVPNYLLGGAVVLGLLLLLKK